MSQEQLTSSEELSDFNNDKLASIESVPTSPENNSKEKNPASSVLSTSVNEQKTDLRKIALETVSSSSLNLSNHHTSTTNLIPALSDLSTPDTPLSSTPTPDHTPKVKKEKKEKKEKREKKTTRVINFASGVSTSVPLTGERPIPQAHSSMDDDVLLAIFIILFDNDPKSEGMTVKQICDILVEKHPEMTKISSKTSNLVSAKLNAYVKKVEKGDRSIHYALSRDWADSSPKRMVYVYRGILSPDYPSYVQKMIEQHRREDAKNNAALAANNTNDGNNNNASSNDNDVEMSGLNSNEINEKTKRLNSPMSHDLSTLQSISPSGLQLNKTSPFGNGSIDFDIPQLSVPYSVAPVTASLNITMPVQNINDDDKSDFTIKRKNAYLTVIPDSDDDDDVYNSLRADFGDDDDDDQSDNEESSIYANHGYYRRGSDIITERIPSGVGKRSKSISFINKRSKSHRSNSNSDNVRQMTNPEPRKIVTAAALTPRVPRKQSINNPNAAAAIAALRAVTLSTFSGSTSESVNSITNSIMTDTSVEPSISIKWLETVRSGFLNQDIESPENVSLAELDTLFT